MVTNRKQKKPYVPFSLECQNSVEKFINIRHKPEYIHKEWSLHDTVFCRAT